MEQNILVVWLDPHHNLTDSEGYGGKVWFKRPVSEAEIRQLELDSIKKKYADLQKDYNLLYDTLNPEQDGIVVVRRQ